MSGLGVRPRGGGRGRVIVRLGQGDVRLKQPRMISQLRSVKALPVLVLISSMAPITY